MCVDQTSLGITRCILQSSLKRSHEPKVANAHKFLGRKKNIIILLKLSEEARLTSIPRSLQLCSWIDDSSSRNAVLQDLSTYLHLFKMCAINESETMQWTLVMMRANFGNAAAASRKMEVGCFQLLENAHWRSDNWINRHRPHFKRSSHTHTHTFHHTKILEKNDEQSMSKKVLRCIV